MGISTTVLERAGLHVDPEEFDRLVADALEEVVPLRPSPDPASELSEGELTLLATGGMRFDPLPADAGHPLVRTAAQYAALLGSSLSVTQVAAHLGVAESRIRQRLGERTLYGIKRPGGWRLPRFQFVTEGAGGGTGDSTVPGVEQVLPHLPPDLHPLAVVSWFGTPNPDLTVGQDEHPVSPLDWLSAGMPPADVAALAENAGALA
jgi:hypothetical protein